jgi:uncharacterized membrane protein (DUF441 family)
LINPFIVRKYAALLIAPLLSTIFFFIGFTFYGLWWGVGLLFVGLLMSVFLGNMLLKNTFTDLLEGKGILVLDMNSTGVIRPFLVSVLNPMIEGNYKGKRIQDVFNRKAVYNLAAPKKVAKSKGKAVANITGGLDITIDEEEYNRGRFSLFHYPVLIYNSQLKSIVTKDFLADQEQTYFIEHISLYLSHKVRDLSSNVTHFARHVIESLKPKTALQANWVFWVAVVLVGILVIALLPKIIGLFGGSGDILGSAFGSAKGAVTPIADVAANGG